MGEAIIVTTEAEERGEGFIVKRREEERNGRVEEEEGEEGECRTCVEGEACTV